MFHFFSGKIEDFENLSILKNDYFGIKIIYFGDQKEGNFFLFPVIDSNNSTIYYLAFDNINQLELFSKLHKISGLSYKLSNYISTFFSIEEVKNALDNNDIKFFTQIPGIGVKTAKKILLELKDKIEVKDLEEISKDEKRKEKVIRTLVGLGYNKLDVINALNSYNGDFSDFQKVIKYIISRI